MIIINCHNNNNEDRYYYKDYHNYANNNNSIGQTVFEPERPRLPGQRPQQELQPRPRHRRGVDWRLFKLCHKVGGFDFPSVYFSDVLVLSSFAKLTTTILFYFVNCNFPMNPHVRLFGWSVGWSVRVGWSVIIF